MSRDRGNCNVTGKNIQAKRIKHGYTSLRSFCEALERERGIILDHSNLDKIEKGDRGVSDILIDEIAKMLQEEYSEFFK